MSALVFMLGAWCGIAAAAWASRDEGPAPDWVIPVCLALAAVCAFLLVVFA